jgi:tetratricopeptide (TPR) repeat protein
MLTGLVLALAAFSAPAPTPAPAKSATSTKPATSAKPSTATKPTGATTAKKPAAKPGVTKSVLELARETREIEDAGGYARAAAGLRNLRARVIRDADLDLFLALDEARSGAIDSARTRLMTPLMDAAVKDTLPWSRRMEYPYQREGAWLNGRFDGWTWYVWRARAEIAAMTRRWPEAYEASRQSVAARPLSGKDWLILAVAAAQTQRESESKEAAAHAAALDPTLPEAPYLLGLWAWKAGKRNEAQEAFRRAVTLDSAFVQGALGMMRSRIPGLAPDTLPTELLTGRRRAGLITAPEGPKPEENFQVDIPAMVSYSPEGSVSDSIPTGVRPFQLILSLLVDEQGRPVINDFPWFPPPAIPEWKITRMLNTVPTWRFTPAIKLGSPHAVWVSMDFQFVPEPAGSGASVRKD